AVSASCPVDELRLHASLLSEATGLVASTVTAHGQAARCKIRGTGSAFRPFRPLTANGSVTVDQQGTGGGSPDRLADATIAIARLGPSRHRNRGLAATEAR